MQRLRSFWKRPGPAKLEPDVADPVANLPTAVHKQLCTADPFRCIDLRISEEIDARLRSDLAQELYDPIEDPTHSPLSSIFAYPQAPPNRANGHANLPARLLDTQDMVRYLAEQRHASSGKERLPNNASSRKSSHCDSIKDEEVAVQAERQTRHALIKTSITIALTSGILCCIILVVLKLSLQKLAQSAVDQAFIDWKGLRIEQLTPDSCHISAEGLFNNINFDGVLKSAEYEILDPNIPTRSVGHITLPDIGFGNAQGTLFRLDESVVFLNAAASTNFFDGFGNATARFSLRGATTLTWRKFGSRVHLDPLYTYSSGMVDHVRFSSMNAFNLSTSPGQDQIVFQSGIMVENTSPVSLSLGKVELQLSLQNHTAMTLTASNATLHDGQNLWLVGASFPRQCASCTGPSTVFLSRLLSRVKQVVHLVASSSTVDGQSLQYLSSLAKSFAMDTSFLNPLGIANSVFTVTDAVLVYLSVKELTLDFNILARVLVPYDIHQSLAGLTINNLHLHSPSGQLLASSRRATEVRTLPLHAAIDGIDGSRLFTTPRPMVLDLFDRPAFANALAQQEAGSPENLMRIVGDYAGNLETHAGLVTVENLVFDSPVHFRDVFNRSMIFGASV